MKPILYLTLFFSLIASGADAQPTLTTAELPVAGLAFTMIQDSTYSAAIPAGGANVTWDYSGLQNLLTDTIGFGAAAGTPYAASFPSSNLASQSDNLTDWTYTTSNNTGFYIDGFATPSTVLRFNPPSLFVPVPFSYNQTRSNTARIVQDTVIIDTTGTPRNVRFIIHQASAFLADGYGTLILPNGTFNDILRVKNTKVTYDSLLVELFPGNWITLNASASQATYYRYFEAGSPSSYILGIEADSLGNTSFNSEYRGQWILLGTSAPSADAGLNAFPNPVNDRLHITGEFVGQADHIRLLDASGRIVLEQAVAFPGTQTIPVRELADGLYQVIVTGTRESRQLRVLVQH